MKTTKLILTAVLAAAFFAGCKKDETPDPAPNNPANPVTGTLANFFTNNQPGVQSFTVDATQWQTITATGGTSVMFGPNAFVTQNNQPVTGSVTVKLQEVYTKKGMILANASTTSGGRPLISGGEFKLTASQNNQELKLAPGAYVFAQMPTGSNPSFAMSEFYASELDANSDFTAIDTAQTIPVVQDSISGGTLYAFQVDSLGWINCDFFMSGSPLTPINITVPSNFNDTNCMVFVAFNSQNSAARAYYYLSSSSQFNFGSFYQLPLGMSVTFVAIGEINGQLYSAFSSTTIVNNHNETLTLAPVSETQLQTQLNNL